MSKFKENVKEKLQSLKKNNVIVHYPLYANTYTLPFFYYDSFFSEDKDMNSKIKLCNWDDDILESITDNNIHVFFATEQKKVDNETQSKKNSKKEQDYIEYAQEKGFKCDKAVFCEYYPRFIFLDFSINAYRSLFCCNEKNEQIDIERKYKDCYKEIAKYTNIDNFITEHFLKSIPTIFKDNYSGLNTNFEAFFGKEKIRIFTEMPNEAAGIAILLETKGGIDKKNITTIQHTDIQQISDKQGKHIDLYFYSAPYNMMFLTKKFQYIPLQISTDKVSITEEVTDIYKYFDTYCYVVTKNESKKDKLQEITKALTEFFQYVFWKAKETPEHFCDITKSFNSISAIKQPTIIFDDEYCFAKCLSLHIRPDVINEKQKSEIKDGKLSKRLLFESLFNRSHNAKYNRNKIELLGQNVKQVYSLIVLNYLLSDIEKIHSFNNKTFSSVCQAIENADFNYDFYNKLMDNFVSYQAQKLIDECKNEEGNPIYDAINNSTWKIEESKIRQRLIYETKRYFYDVLIKECKAEDVFYISKEKDESTREHTFEIEDFLKDAVSTTFTDTTKNEIEKSIEFLKKSFANVLDICSNYFDDIVEYEICGLSAIFGNNVVAKLIASKNGGSTPAV